MLSSIITVALLSLTALATEQGKRQATDAARFTSAEDELISEYLPSTALPALQSVFSSAASAASVTGDAKSLIYGALLASSVPGWFASAVPSAWSTQIAALESNINALRPSASSGATPVVIAVTTTDSKGSTFTTSVTSTPSVTGTATTATTTSKAGSGAGSTYSSLTTEVIGGITSVFSVAVSGGSSVGSIAVSGASSVATAGVGGASSLISSASSKARAAAPTPVSGAAAAGVLGLVGMMIAL